MDYCREFHYPNTLEQLPMPSEMEGPAVLGGAPGELPGSGAAGAGAEPGPGPGAVPGTGTLPGPGAAAVTAAGGASAILGPNSRGHVRPNNYYNQSEGAAVASVRYQPPSSYRLAGPHLDGAVVNEPPVGQAPVRPPQPHSGVYYGGYNRHGGYPNVPNAQSIPVPHNYNNMYANINNSGVPNNGTSNPTNNIQQEPPTNQGLNSYYNPHDYETTYGRRLRYSGPAAFRGPTYAPYHHRYRGLYEHMITAENFHFSRANNSFQRMYGPNPHYYAPTGVPFNPSYQVARLPYPYHPHPPITHHINEQNREDQTPHLHHHQHRHQHQHQHEFPHDNQYNHQYHHHHHHNHHNHQPIENMFSNNCLLSGNNECGYMTPLTTPYPNIPNEMIAADGRLNANIPIQNPYMVNTKQSNPSLDIPPTPSQLARCATSSSCTDSNINLCCGNPQCKPSSPTDYFIDYSTGAHLMASTTSKRLNPHCSLRSNIHFCDDRSTLECPMNINTSIAEGMIDLDSDDSSQKCDEDEKITKSLLDVVDSITKELNATGAQSQRPVDEDDDSPIQYIDLSQDSGSLKTPPPNPLMTLDKDSTTIPSISSEELKSNFPLFSSTKTYEIEDIDEISSSSAHSQCDDFSNLKETDEQAGTSSSEQQAKRTRFDESSLDQTKKTKRGDNDGKEDNDDKKEDRSLKDDDETQDGDPGKKSDDGDDDDSSDYEIQGITPLPGFQQAFGSMDIGRFSETFLNVPNNPIDAIPFVTVVQEYQPKSHSQSEQQQRHQKQPQLQLQLQQQHIQIQPQLYTYTQHQQQQQQQQLQKLITTNSSEDSHFNMRIASLRSLCGENLREDNVETNYFDELFKQMHIDKPEN